MWRFKPVILFVLLYLASYTVLSHDLVGVARGPLALAALKTSGLKWLVVLVVDLVCPKRNRKDEEEPS